MYQQKENPRRENTHELLLNSIVDDVIPTPDELNIKNATIYGFLIKVKNEMK